MKKFADTYFQVHPWKIIEEGFAPAYGQVAESVFSLGNEYTGLRGYFDEGYSGETLQGSYLNGLYERRILPKSGYKGMLPFTEFMVNTVDWVYTRLWCNGSQLDLASSRFTNFRRELDLRTGVLRRSFCWQPDGETEMEVVFERFTSMNQEQYAGQKLELHCSRGTAKVKILAGLDFTRPHVSMGESMFRTTNRDTDGNSCQIQAQTRVTCQQVWAAAAFRGLEGCPEETGEGIAASRFTADLSAGEGCRLERAAALLCARNEEEKKTFSGRIREAQAQLAQLRYEELKAASAHWWEKQWKVSDIEIQGAEVDQQGIRFCIFQLHQTLHTAKYGAVFGAKGLTGEAYNGNTFWDSEVYCLPFYLFSNPAAARSILDFRYDTLPQAMERARNLDCDGAFYPIATISGHECCDLWQHASLQLQASTGVAYGLWHYTHVTGDREYLHTKGVKILIEISRMLASRGGFDPVTGQYGYYCVMGPDEFQMMVHHDAYTNFMAQKALRFTVETLEQMDAASLGVTAGEIADWKNKADRMCILYDEKTKVFEQNLGYFHMPHQEISQIPVEDFPLYSHWSYDRIYRNDMLKQPAVLMFMMLHVSDFTAEQIAANYDYYDARCMHESSLSPSIHAILACRLGRMKEANRYFGFATRMDLDDYNRNTREGLHTTSIAGAWMNIVYGFGGLTSDGAVLTLRPSIPEGWTEYSFCIRLGDAVVRVGVNQSTVTLRVIQGERAQLRLYHRDLAVTEIPADYPLEDNYAVGH